MMTMVYTQSALITHFKTSDFILASSALTSVVVEANSRRTASRSAFISESPRASIAQDFYRFGSKMPLVPKDAGEPERIEQKRVHGGTMRRHAAKVQLRKRAFGGVDGCSSRPAGAAADAARSPDSPPPTAI